MRALAALGIVEAGERRLAVLVEDDVAVLVAEVVLGVGDLDGAVLIERDPALETADAAHGAVLAGIDVEVVAVAVRADALLALVLGVLGILGGLGEVDADLVRALDDLVLHEGGLSPGDPLVVDDLPRGGHGLDLVLGLDVGAPVGAADADVAHGDAGVEDALGRDGALAAVLDGALGDLHGDEVVAGVHAGPEAVHDGVEQAGDARLEDGVDHDDAVGGEHLPGEPVEVVLVDAEVAAAAHEGLDAGDAAGAVLDLEVLGADELDLAAGLLGTLEHLLADAVVVAVLGAERDAENLSHDGIPLLVDTHESEKL